ncbi:Long-chain-fatty-acid--CoA ligase [Anoxybacillus sp. BCO1]|nr:Long-chain-fatty-acid--CoA ligase [Anoxybacillus sp. BCO1]
MNLVSRLQQIATQKPDKQAYMFDQTSATYGELNGAIMKFASGLEKLGVNKGIMWRYC